MTGAFSIPFSNSPGSTRATDDLLRELATDVLLPVFFIGLFLGPSISFFFSGFLPIAYKQFILDNNKI